MNLKANDILICRGNSELSKTILKATDGEFSHTAQIIELNGLIYVFDAQKGGCMPRTFENWKREFNYTFEVYRNPKENQKDLSNWFMQFSGVKYDVKGLSIGLIKSFVKNTFNAKTQMKEKFRNNGLFWCSELSMKPYVMNPEQFSPQDVFEWLVFNKWKKIDL
jgi:hypothetical protein